MNGRLIFVIAIMLEVVGISYAAENWKISVDTDEMTEEKTCYALSKNVPPTRPMGFPYNDTRAWLGIGYDGKKYWVFVGFNTIPNILDTDISSSGDYEYFFTRVKWDRDTIESVELSHDVGSRFLHFYDDDKIIEKIKNHKTMLLELKWFGEGKVYFKFPLTGAKEAIDKITRICGKPKQSPE